MVIKVAVCDDEPQALRQIDTYLAQFQLEADVTFQIFYFSSGEDVLLHMPRDIKILLLDIQMSGISGIEVARKLREEGSDFYLFFITNNTQYALEGYSVHAFAFLDKPLKYPHLKSYFTEVVHAIHRAKPVFLEVKNGASSTIINCNDLVYIEVYGHTSIAVLENGQRITQKISLDDLEKKLTKHGFFRSHKSFLINLHKVRSITPSDIIMSNGTSVALSRNRKHDFWNAFHEIAGEHI